MRGSRGRSARGGRYGGRRCNRTLRTSFVLEHVLDPSDVTIMGWSLSTRWAVEGGETSCHVARLSTLAVPSTLRPVSGGGLKGSAARGGAKSDEHTQLLEVHRTGTPPPGS